MTEHDQKFDVPTPPAAGQTDVASRSLADAMRVSFRLLTVIMLLVVVAFLLTGLESVEPQEVGIKKVFGPAFAQAEQGLAYTWPFPIGQIELVKTSTQSVTIDDFWLHETARDQSLSLDERQMPQEELRPGYDGALLTGDRNLLHVQLVVQYAIDGPEGAMAVKRSLGDVEAVVRSVVNAAAIAAAARRTADGIQRGQKKEFTADISKASQQALNELTPDREGRPFEAVRINSISVVRSTWPLRARPAYLAAQEAISWREQIRSQAVADARRILNEAAGASHGLLVGDPEEFAGATEQTLTQTDQAGPRDLIGGYHKAQDPAETEKLVEEIEEVLLGSQTGGQASKLIAEARAYRTQVIQNADARAKRFEELLVEYAKTPDFMLQRLWADVRDAILSSPTVEKVYVTPGKQKTVYRLKQPAEIARAIRRELLKREKETEPRE